MVAYNFIKEFADDVESGKKLCTIRKVGKRRHARVGEQIQLYTGMQTNACRLLGLGLCDNVTPIHILPSWGEIHLQAPTKIHWLVFDSDESLNKLAQRDGFPSLKEFFDYFEPQVDDKGVFEGLLIGWEPLV
jgi:hypothetical protein